jgi:hypothetical protein
MAKGIRSQAYPEIEAAVKAEYADRFRAAGFLQRIALRWRIRLEVNRRVSREIADRLPSEDVLW